MESHNDVDKLRLQISKCDGASREIDVKAIRLFAGKPKGHWFAFFGLWVTDYNCPALTRDLNELDKLTKMSVPGYEFEIWGKEGRIVNHKDGFVLAKVTRESTMQLTWLSALLVAWANNQMV